MYNIDNNTTIFQYFGEVVTDSSWLIPAGLRNITALKTFCK